MNLGDVLWRKPQRASGKPFLRAPRVCVVAKSDAVQVKYN